MAFEPFVPDAGDGPDVIKRILQAVVLKLRALATSVTTVVTDLTAHVAAADPHTGYQKESEKGQPNGYASLGPDSLVPQSQLGTGTQDGTRFLRDDGTWQAVAGTPASFEDTIRWWVD